MHLYNPQKLEDSETFWKTGQLVMCRQVEGATKHVKRCRRAVYVKDAAPHSLKTFFYQYCILNWLKRRSSWIFLTRSIVGVAHSLSNQYFTSSCINLQQDEINVVVSTGHLSTSYNSGKSWVAAYQWQCGGVTHRSRKGFAYTGNSFQIR